MRKRLEQVKDKRQIESILLICFLVITSMVVVFPLSAPKAEAQIVQHLASTMAEDGIFPYDMDGSRNNIVVWDKGQDHYIMENYTVDAGYTLDIPALDYRNDPSNSKEITFKKDDTMITVWGKFITNTDDGNPTTRTLFWGGDVVNWKGIYFRPGSEGCIHDCTFKGARNALVFFPAVPGIGPASKLIYPGINMSTFTDMGKYGVRIEGVTGYKNIGYCDFKDTYNSSIGLQVTNMDLKVEHCYFRSHGDNKSCLNIRNANVYCYNSDFWGDFHPGNVVHIENPLNFGGTSDGTIMHQCKFRYGASGDYLVKVDSSAPLIYNCSFYNKYGELSLVANEEDGTPAHPIIRNPSADGSPGFYDDTFDNTTMKATGNSSITLQWLMDVFVKDPNGNLIDNAPVRVKDRLGNPSEPSLKITDDRGWASGFAVTEFIQYNNSVDNFNPFNVSAEAFSMVGYAVPEPMMNMSKRINVTVPFNLNNVLPVVSLLIPPQGVQAGDIIIQFELFDPDPSDNGNLSVEVFYSLDGLGWRPTTQGSGSCPTTKLLNNTLYNFVWDSKGPIDLPNMYNTTVYIMILPYDRVGPGTPSQTGNFTVDNEAPALLSGPFVTLIADTAIIEWTVHEPADANLWWGLTPNFPNQKSGNTGSTLQSVTLTGLQQGRNYTYFIESTDSVGNKFFSGPHTFITEIHIQLYKGWNMISIPPNIDPDLETVLRPIVGQYDAVQVYEVSDPNDPWEHYKVGKPWGNDLKIVHSGRGLWIHMKNDAVLVPEHNDPTTNPMFTGAVPIKLEPGWNFVGYPSITTRLIGDALTNVPYDMVQTYDAFTRQWLSYDPGGYSTDTLTQMETGRGYWIHCTSPFLWQVDYV